MAKNKQTPEYQKAYKDEKRIVIYVEPEQKSLLAQHALDQNKSLSEICKPAIARLVRGLK